MRYIINADPKLKTMKPEDICHLPAYVIFSEIVKSDTAKQFRADLLAAEQKAIAAGQTVLPVVIDTYGGDCYAMMGMGDAIKACSVPVATIIEGKAMSAGVYLFSCGAEGRRYIGENATVMIHEVSSEFWGKNEEVQADAKETERLNRQMLTAISRNIGKEDDFLAKQIHERSHADWYLTPAECVAINLANRIGAPSINVNISITHTFS